MIENIDLGTIIFVITTVIIFYQLCSVLGRRTGNERKSLDPFSSSHQKENVSDNFFSSLQGNDVELEKISTYKLIDEISSGNPDLNKGFKSIKKVDPSFNPEDFMKGAKIAYEMVILAYYEGDKKILKNLLSKKVFEKFVSVLEEKEKKEEKTETSFVGIDKAEFLFAELKGTEAEITVSFVSKCITATFDAQRNLIAGSQEKLVEMRDVWRFVRNIKSSDLNWKISATESDC